MKNPKVLLTVNEGADYVLPTYRVTDNGIEDGEGLGIRFCKGDKSDPSKPRQEGFFTKPSPRKPICFSNGMKGRFYEIKPLSMCVAVK
jgi:hypothetical protein